MKSLRIAVDARPLAIPMVGITRYTLELLKRLPEMGHEWFLYLDKAPIHPLPEFSNVHVRYGNSTGALGSTMFAQVQFPRWAKKDKIDVFWSPRHHLPLLLPRSIHKVLTVHDLVWIIHPETMSRFGRWAERLLMPSSLRLADQIVTVSESTKEDIQKNFKSLSTPSATVYPGIVKSKDIHFENLVGKPYFLFVGTLEPRKNLLRLLAAFREVASGPSEVLLVVIGGEGWGQISLRQRVEELRLNGQVLILDRVNDQQLHNYYAYSRGVVMPSLYEGFGLPLAEAMMHGVPVITSNRGATKEVAGEAGILIDPYDVDAIAAAMMSLLDDRCYEKLSDLAKNRANIFSWEKSAKELLPYLEGR